MIVFLNKIENADEREFGKQILSLINLCFNDLPLESTLLISNRVFKSYKDSNRHDFNSIDSIIGELTKRLEAFEYIDLNPSFLNHINGIPSFKRVPNNSKIIKEKLLNIYDSWFDNYAEAHRITYSIKDEETFPAIYVQPSRINVESYVTRCPKTGKITNQENTDNIHNTIKSVSRESETLFFQLESILKAPVKFYYYFDSGKIIIRDVEQETMNQHAKWYSINDLYLKKIINNEEFVTLLDPNMIFGKSGFKPIDKTNNNLSSIEGLPASPGIAIGKLIFRQTRYNDFSDYSIFCCNEMIPDDIEELNLAAGAISTRGGMLSHLAVVAKAMGKPAVTGASFSINMQRRELIIGNKIFPENSFVAVDGNNGNIFVSTETINIENNYVANSSYEYLQASYLLLKKMGTSLSFKDYSLDFQMKIATLLSAFNKIDFKL